MNFRNWLAESRARRALISRCVLEIGWLGVPISRYVLEIGWLGPESSISMARCITVINGFSQVMLDVFGNECGIGARSAIGNGILPNNIPVKIEAIFELKE